MVKHHHHQQSTRILNENEEDYISLLPDCLHIDIISRLPSTEEAIRTGTLSKRWQHLWPCVSNLIFIHHNKLHEIYKFAYFVDKTLTQCPQSNLHKFEIHTPYYAHLKSQVNEWIRYAVGRNVQDLDLNLTEFVADDFILINSCFTHLKLGGCVFNPTGAISWTKLTSLSIFDAKLSEDLIHNILSGCPLLETLELRRYCYGFRRVDITSKSVKNFVLSGYRINEYDEERIYGINDVIEINAPYIVSLTITNGLWLSELMLVDVSCLVKAHLDYRKHREFYPTCEEVWHEETLKGLILSLRHVKELKIGESCLKVLSRLEDKGFTFPLNMEYLDDWPDYDSSESVDCSDNDSTESGDQ